MNNTFKKQVLEIIKAEFNNYDFSKFENYKDFEKTLNKLNKNPIVTNLLYIFGIDNMDEFIGLIKQEAIARYNEVHNETHNEHHNEAHNEHHNEAKTLKPLWKQKFDGTSNAYDNTCGDTCCGDTCCGDTCCGDTCCEDECCDEYDNTSNMYNAGRYDVTNTSPVKKELEIYRTTNTANINDDILDKLNNIVNNYVNWFVQNDHRISIEQIETMRTLLFDFAGYIFCQ